MLDIFGLVRYSEFVFERETQVNKENEMIEPIYNETHPTVIRVNEKTGIHIEIIVEVLNASFEVYTEEIHETLGFD